MQPTFVTGKTVDSGPQKIVLAMVAQQPDSIAGLSRRIDEMFPSAGFARNAAHTNIPILAAKGLVHLAHSDPQGRATFDRYEVTSAGRKEHLEWLRRFDLRLLLRDLLQSKIEFLEPADLAGFLRLVRTLEKEATDLCDEAQAKVLREQRLRRRRQHEAKRPDWRARLRGIKNKDDVNLMSLLSQRFERLGDDVEALLTEITSEATE